MTFVFDDHVQQGARIKVIGLGGAGGNAVNGMINAGLHGVDFVAVNTDNQALESNQAPNTIQIGRHLTKGLGAGSNPEIGLKALEEDREAIEHMLANTDMAFITAGMGGGTGTGASPILAETARSLGVLTVAIVTKPFRFEGVRRMQQAEEGIDRLKQRADTLIVIPNERLLAISTENTTLSNSFKMADDILYQATKGISDLINVTGLINLDFADNRTVMSETGDAIMGTGVATGEHRATEAAEQAISSPLLEEVSISGAKGLLVNITGGDDLTIHEVNAASSLISEAAGTEANVIFGAVIDEQMAGTLRITVIATGFNSVPRRSTLSPTDTTLHRELPDNIRMIRKTPTFMRPPGAESHQGDKSDTGGGFSDDLDIPAFLRKQMD